MTWQIKHFHGLTSRIILLKRPAKRESIGSYLANRGNTKNGYDSFGEECSTPPELVYDRFKFFPFPENSKTFSEAQNHCESFGDGWGLMILNTGTAFYLTHKSSLVLSFKNMQ